jgi:hypothetical protein
MPQFTAATARENAAKSHVVRKLNYAVAKQALKGQPQAAQPTTAMAAQTAAADDYSLRTLARVRDQIDQLADMMKKETDPARLDRLAAAFAKLSEVERQLAGRPLPGSYRPSTKSSAAGMIESPNPIAAAPNSSPAVQSEGQE